MNTRKLLLTSLLAAATMSVPANADIYINFASEKGAMDGNWNNTKTQSGTVASLKDFQTGETTGTSMTYSSKNTWEYTERVTDNVLKGYLDDGVTADGHYAQVTLSGISYRVYDVVVLAATDTANANFAAVTINGTAYTSDVGIAVEGDKPWGASQNATIVPGVNSMTLSGVTGASLSINGGASANNNGIRGGIAGIKIFDQTGRIWGATLSGDVNWGNISWSCTDGSEPDAKAWSAITADNLTADLSGTGTVTVGAEGVTLNRLRVLSGTTTLAGGIVTLNGSQNAVYAASGATLSLDTTQISRAEGVSFVTLAGAGTIAFTDADGTAAYNKIGTDFKASSDTAVRIDGAVRLDLGDDALVFSGGSREFAGGLSVSGLGLGVSSGATVTISGGTSSFTGGISNTQISDVQGRDNSVLVSGSGSVLNITDGVLTLTRSIGTRAGGVINQSGGTVTATALRLHDSGNASGTSIYNLSGGVLNISSTNTANSTSSGVLIGHWGNGKGELNVTGGVLNAASTVAVVSWTSPGEMSISGGEVNLKGISLKGQGTNAATVTLSGNGRLNLGSSGLATGNNGNGTKVYNLNGGTLGALEDWAAGSGVTLNVGGAVAIDTTKRVTSENGASSAATGADAGATITLGNIEFLDTGALTVSGAGMLELAGTVNVGDSGSIALTAGTLKLASTGTLNGTISATGGKLELAGKLNLTSAISVADSVSVTIFDTTVFNFTDSLKTAEGVYTLISGGTISGWDTLTGSNFTYNGVAIAGRQLIFSSEAGVVSYDASATAKTLTWNGDGSAVWKAVTITETPTAKPWLDGDTAEAFYNGDSVIFATAAQVSVEGTVNPAAITVSANTTFTGTGRVEAVSSSLTFSNDAVLTLGDNVTLALGGENGAGIASYASENIVGTGTLEFAAVGNTTDSGGSDPTFSTISLGTEFRGTVEITSGIVDMLTLTGDGTSAISSERLGNASKVVLNGGGLLFRNVDNTTQNDKGTFDKAIEVGADGGVIRVYGNGNVTVASDISGAGTLRHTDGGTLTLTGTINMTGGFSQVAGTTNFNGSTTLGTLTVSAGTTTFASTASADVTTANISGGTLNVSGAATLGTLNVTGGTTNFSGVTNITSATVTDGTTNFRLSTLNESASFASATNISVSGGTVMFGEDDNTLGLNSFGENIALTVSGSGRATFAISKGDKKIFSGTLKLENGGTYYKHDGSVELAGNVTLGEADSNVVYLLGNWGKAGTKISGSLSGAGTAYFGNDGYSDTPTEKLTISGSNNSYSGEIIVGKKNANEGSAKNTELVLSAVTALQNGKVNLAGSAANNYAKLTLDAPAITIAGLSGTEFGKVALDTGVASSTLTVNQASNTTFAGTIEGGIALKKAGVGTLTLSGDNTFTGGVTIEQGVLVAANASALGTGNTVRIAGGQLKVGNGTTAVSLNAAAYTIVLSDAYSETSGTGVAAIVGSDTTSKSSIALATDTKITIELADSVAVSLAAEAAQYQYKIFDVATIHAGSFSVENFVLAEALQGTWQISDYTNGVLTLTIPEPSVFGLLAGLGALALAGTRRRRKKA